MKGHVWYARLSAALIMAIVTWCVYAVASSTLKVQGNTTKIEVQAIMIEGVREDVREIKTEQREMRLEQREDFKEIKTLIREGG